MTVPAVGSVVDTIRAARIVGPGAETLADEGPWDLFLRNGRIVDLAPTGAVRPRGEVLDAEGGGLIPGLWDHHVHTVQWALVAERIALGGAASAAEAAGLLRGVTPQPDGRIVGSGFRDAFWADTPTRAMLDAVTGETPTYLINADVHSVWLNTAALRREGIDPTHPDAGDGLLREGPAFEISRRLNAASPAVADRLVADAARRAAERGVVGLVDLDMAWNEEAWARRLAGGFDTLRVEFGLYPDMLDRALAEGMRSGDPVRGAANGLVHVGPLKVITDGSLGTRTAACSHGYPGDPHDHGMLTVDPAELVELMTRATGGGLRCAIHAIGDIANAHALDAYAQTGATGTIEHAQLVAHADLFRFARLGVAASVQPEHAIDDRDLADTIWAEQTALAYPLRALADAGANLRFGSDAPVSPLDPWAGIAAAVFRTRDGRPAWRGDQAVSLHTALAASTAGGSTTPHTVGLGLVADLALLGADPFAADETAMRAMPVTATLLAGRLTHGG